MFSAINSLKVGFISTLAVAIGVSGLGMVDTASAAKKEELQRAAVSVYVKPSIEGSQVRYEVSAVNNGKGPAQNTSITIPYNDDLLDLVSVDIKGSGAWVTDRSDDSLTVKIEKLTSGGDSCTIDVLFESDAELSAGAVIGDRLSYTWNDSEGKSSGQTNLPILNAGQSYFDLSVSPASAPAKTVRAFSSDAIFAPGELVTFWYNSPDGVAHELEVKGVSLVDADSTKSKDNGGAFIAADQNGAIYAEFDAKDLPAGSYSLVARGSATGFIATVAFEVE